jgi:hypothetical protein
VPKMNIEVIGSCMSLKKYKLNYECARHIPYFYFSTKKDTFLFTFTIISHAKSVQLLYMLKHSRKYDHAYFTFHIDRLEFTLKMRMERK